MAENDKCESVYQVVGEELRDVTSRGCNDYVTTAHGDWDGCATSLPAVVTMNVAADRAKIEVAPSDGMYTHLAQPSSRSGITQYRRRTHALYALLILLAIGMPTGMVFHYFMDHARHKKSENSLKLYNDFILPVQQIYVWLLSQRQLMACDQSRFSVIIMCKSVR